MQAEGAASSGTTAVAVHDGRLDWSGRLYMANEGAQARAAGRDSLRNGLALITVCLYLLFNWGFMQVRVPPVAGGGVPVGEIVLFLFLLTLNFTAVLGRLSASVLLLPFMVWWTFGVGRAMVDFWLHGAWALRDAAHVVESLFLVVGFVFAGDRRSLDRFFDWLPKLLVIGVLYGLLYPIRDQIWAISPTIPSGNGIPAPIFGTMANTPYLLIMAATYLILFHPKRPLANLGAIAILGYALAIFQQRTLYLILIAVFGFLFLYRRSTLGQLGLVIGGGWFVLALITLLGIQLQGRLGDEIGFDFLAQHFMAIFGVSSNEYQGVASAAAGIDQRLGWWTKIFDQMLADPVSLLLGLGFGVPLIDFAGNSGAIAREPHNSYITVLARTGIIGGVSWVLITIALLRRWHRAFRLCRARGWRLGENRLLLLMVFFICMWVLAIGEDAFEKPYNIIPFYFFWGIVLRFGLLLERGEIGPEPAAPAHGHAMPPLGDAAPAADPPAAPPASPPLAIRHLLPGHTARRPGDFLGGE